MRLAIFGGGKGATPHFEALRHVEGVECVAVAEVSPERRKELADAFGVRTYADYEDLLHQEKPEAVLVALPHHLHEAAAEASLAAGAHVLVEKPLAISIEGCNRIIDAAKRHGRTLMVGHTHHFYPNIIEAQRIVRSGELGEVMLSTDTIYGPYFKNRSAWFLDKQRSGGGSWMTNGIHLVDRTCWLLGDIPERIFARMTFHPDYPEMETSVSATLEFADGKTATILMAMQASGPKEEGEILGDKGTLRYSAWGALERSDGSQRWPVEPTAKGNGRALQIRAFAEAVATGSEPPVTGEWAREMVRVVLAGYESQQRGEPVSIQTIG